MRKLIPLISLGLLIALGSWFMSQNNKMSEKFLYKVVSPKEWQQSQKDGFVQKGVIDTTFIHLATKDQIDRITKKFWAGKPYLILKLDVSKLVGDLRFEKNPGGQTKFYHLYYGRIPLSSVVETR